MIDLLYILILLAVSAFLVFWYGRRPRHDRDWRPEMLRLPQISMNGSFVTIKNIRCFNWRSEIDCDTIYYDRTFDLGGLCTLDYIHQPFHNWPMAAHTFLSFGWEDGTRLAISVEARRKRNRRFSAIKGLFRFFELIYIFADERDILVNRAIYHGDKVFIYPLKADKIQIQKLFLIICKRAVKLSSKPEFYHTVTNTCSNNLLKCMKPAFGLEYGFDWRILFPAYFDRLLFSFGLIDPGMDPAQSRKRFQINDKAKIHRFDTNFSLKIR